MIYVLDISGERRRRRKEVNCVAVVPPWNKKETYIVNFATGEVINKTSQVTGSGKPLYTYSVDLR